MSSIQLETKIEAPLERVFDLARNVDAHTASTGRPNERVISGRTLGSLQMEEVVTWETRRFGMKKQVTVKVTSLTSPHCIISEIISGPSTSMRHTRLFLPQLNVTLVKDDFHFPAPHDFLGKLVGWIFPAGYMKRFSQIQSRALKELAESDGWQRYPPSHRSIRVERNYLEGLLHLKEAIEYLQSDKAGFRHPQRPERLNVSPAKLTQLMRWVSYFSESHQTFVPFFETVINDYLSPDTSPATFDSPLYRSLYAAIEEQLRLESASVPSVPRE